MKDFYAPILSKPNSELRTRILGCAGRAQDGTKKLVKTFRKLLIYPDSNFDSARELAGCIGLAQTAFEGSLGNSDPIAKSSDLQKTFTTSSFSHPSASLRSMPLRLKVHDYALGHRSHQFWKECSNSQEGASLEPD